MPYCASYISLNPKHQRTNICVKSTSRVIPFLYIFLLLYSNFCFQNWFSNNVICITLIFFKILETKSICENCKIISSLVFKQLVLLWSLLFSYFIGCVLIDCWKWKRSLLYNHIWAWLLMFLVCKLDWVCLILLSILIIL